MKRVCPIGYRQLPIELDNGLLRKKAQCEHLYTPHAMALYGSALTAILSALAVGQIIFGRDFRGRPSPGRRRMQKRSSDRSSRCRRLSLIDWQDGFRTGICGEPLRRRMSNRGETPLGRVRFDLKNAGTRTT